MSFFGGLFDFNRDGGTDWFEMATGLAMMDECLEEKERRKRQNELELAGLDRDELRYMDESKRRDILEDAGLDPDDYDFDD